MIDQEEHFETPFNHPPGHYRFGNGIFQWRDVSAAVVSFGREVRIFPGISESVRAFYVPLFEDVVLVQLFPSEPVGVSLIGSYFAFSFP